jgi:primosomal protein N' (replication factor Y)
VLGYPPFSHLIRIVCSAERGEPARRAAVAVRDALDGRVAGGEGARGSIAVLGPAPLFRLRGRERESLVVKASSRLPAVQAIGEAVQRVAGSREHRGVNFSVDVDPQ